jgi:hypothetical protein
MNADELKKRMAALPPLEKAPNHTWARNRYEIRKHTERDDLGLFLRWSTMIATMVVLDAPYIEGEFRDTPRWLIPKENGFGGIETLPWADWTSGNAVHQAYHLWQWMQRSKLMPGELGRVFEFGGGYGAMCRIFREQGFDGEYMIYDVPEFSLLQEYYLSNVAPHGQTGFSQELPETGVDLFIGLYSMSEVDTELREKAMQIPAKSYLFAYQSEYGGCNNLAWFGELPLCHPELIWHIWSPPHLGLNHRYAVGVPRW